MFKTTIVSQYFLTETIISIMLTIAIYTLGITIVNKIHAE